MNLIEIEKPNHDQKLRIDQAREDFNKMMESIKPFSKKHQTRTDNQKIEWTFTE